MQFCPQKPEQCMGSIVRGLLAAGERHMTHSLFFPACRLLVMAEQAEGNQAFCNRKAARQGLAAGLSGSVAVA